MLEQQHSDSDSGCITKYWGWKGSHWPPGYCGKRQHLESEQENSEIQLTHLKIGSDDERSHEAMHTFVKRSYNKCLSNTYDEPAGIFQTTSHCPLICSETSLMGQNEL